jgi:hypothetical protein
MAMLRVKIFSSVAYEGDIRTLEDAINDWLASARPMIRQVVQSSTAEEALVVTFLYDAGQLETSVRMASAAVPEAFERSLNDLGLDPADEEPTVLPDAELPY